MDVSTLWPLRFSQCLRSEITTGRPPVALCCCAIAALVYRVKGRGWAERIALPLPILLPLRNALVRRSLACQLEVDRSSVGALVVIGWLLLRQVSLPKRITAHFLPVPSNRSCINHVQLR